ncbi:DUF4255 domain-containing protein [Bradyrhizobium yuanmingense]|uniref:DUF4255 domain-containing protein n=1 Tax=Bradyrhizobium yuanmingense TaxID=108015 RepID=UPI0023B98CB0|nr:DUF4255 domain-containing protein [Bradyrhizobium yuanmingense]MDF0515731.1 DUF4255 domain-containing protein [Bradyrhizobium yuanmingense]
MSNPAAIAAVTATIRNLLTMGVTTDPDLVDTTVTMQAPHLARINGNSANQINIFLYSVRPSGSWSNMPSPATVRPGEFGVPVLGLNLHYLITVFGRDNDAQRPFSHQLLGRAMSTLHDHPLLGADEIKAALPGNDLWNQTERVRFTLHPLSIEEIGKMWPGFQTHYQLSVAYEAAVVMIDSTRPTVTPLPVLTRGQSDRGISALASALSPFPTIDRVELPNKQPAALPGDEIKLGGRNLSGDRVTVKFASPRLAEPIEFPAEMPADDVSSDSNVSVNLPAEPANLPAGLYTIAVIVRNPEQTGPAGNEIPPSVHTSNEMPLSVAPRITSDLPVPVQIVQGTATISLNCVPQVRPDQRVSLLLGSREIPAVPRTAQTGQLAFVVTDAVAGEFWIRLRVDGVDSQLVDYSKSPPIFMDKQKAKLT